MIATVDDVLAGFTALWAAVSGLPAAVTGGLLDWRAIPAATAAPLAVVKVVPGDKETMTGSVYLQKFAVQVWTHSVNGTDDRDGMDRLTASLNFAQAGWPSGHGRCLHVRPVTPPTDPSPFKMQAADVAMTPAAWEVLMQQSG